VQWLQEDGVITAQEAERTVARCSAAESAQLPLVRLANVGVVGAQTRQPLDLETLTQYLAQRSGWPICASTRCAWMWAAWARS
jgi:general secretion pathway protein E